MRIDFEEHLNTFSECKERPGRSGPQLLTRDCPFCGDGGWHLYVNARNGLWKCMKCSEVGSYLRLAAAFLGIPLHEAARTIRGLPPRRAPRVNELGRLREAVYDIDWDGLRGSDPVTVPLPERFKPCYLDGRYRIPKALKRRRLKKRTIREFNLGYCGLGTYGRRIIIPVVTGTEHAFQARAYDSDVYGPKYLSPKVDMGRLLFGEPWLAAGLPRVVVVEGVFDVMRLHEYGIPAVAVLGKSVSERQITILLSRAPREVVLMLDADDPRAEGSAWDAVDRLRGEVKSVRLASLPPGRDPDTATAQEVDDAIAAARDASPVCSTLRGRLSKLRHD